MQRLSHRLLASTLAAVLTLPTLAPAQQTNSDSFQQFAKHAYQHLPVEQSYDYHKRLSTEPVHRPARDPGAQPNENEIAIADSGWKIIIARDTPVLIRHTAEDLKQHLKVAMEVDAVIEEHDNLDNWKEIKHAIIIGTRDQLPEVGDALKKSKDYRLIAGSEQLVVCGFDDRGAMFGTYNLEDRMNLRGGPFVPAELDTIRHSLYQNRMVLNWMGWMEWPDAYLSQIAHDGFDGIFASVYANPNGVPAPEFYSRVRRPTPQQINDLLNRAEKQGLKVYTPIMYLYDGTPESEQGLREHVRDIVTKFPKIHGYVLLTEGFIYGSFFGAGGHGATDLKEWTKHWTHAVAVATEECHKINPNIEILPWEYNVDFRPDKADLKRYVLSQLPKETIPMVTWENGKSFELGPFKGYLRDYSINEVGPAEVTFAQVDEAKKRGQTIYSKVDTFASWQFGTIPYLPVPYQWAKRYDALEKAGIDGTLETWSNGYKPNFVADVRAWSCWTDAPPLEETLRAIARREFGPGNEDTVLAAWKKFSEAITYVPDTGPTMGTNQALANPLFFVEPRPRMMTLNHSWTDRAKWQNSLTGSKVNPLWPYTVQRMIFIPDFTNRANRAESYARSASGVFSRADGQPLGDVAVLPEFNKRLLMAADTLEEGLVEYRKAALATPEAKQATALKEVLIVEQMQRMLRGLHAILSFEDLRLQLAKTEDPAAQSQLLEQMVEILNAERLRAEHSLETSRRDSRLGYQMEQDYVYRPYVLEEKLEVLDETLHEHIPAYRKEHKLP